MTVVDGKKAYYLDRINELTGDLGKAQAALLAATQQIAQYRETVSVQAAEATAHVRRIRALETENDRLRTQLHEASTESRED